MVSRPAFPREQAPAAARTASQPEVVLYSVQGLAEVLGCYPGTVRRWPKVGKPDPQGPYNQRCSICL